MDLGVVLGAEDGLFVFLKINPLVNRLLEALREETIDEHGRGRAIIEIDGRASRTAARALEMRPRSGGNSCAEQDSKS